MAVKNEKPGHWRSDEWPNRHVTILYASIMAILPIAILIFHYSSVGDSEAAEIIQLLAGALMAIAVSVLVLLLSRSDARKLEEGQDKLVEGQNRIVALLERAERTGWGRWPVRASPPSPHQGGALPRQGGGKSSGSTDVKKSPV